MPTQTDILEFDFSKAAPAESRPSKIGEHFPPGARLTFTVESLMNEIADDGRKKVWLSARCNSDVDFEGHSTLGRQLSDSFGMPMAHELAEGKSVYGAQLFHMLMIACGAKPFTGPVKIPLERFKGRTFECICKDKPIAESAERDPNDPAKPRYPARMSSQIDKLFRPATPAADVVAAPATEAPAQQPAPVVAEPVATAPAPAPAAQAPAPAAVAAAPAAAPTNVADAVDALFEQ